MRIWFLTVGEPLPGDNSATRLLRTGQLASWLARSGVDVTFWTNSVDHYRKRQRHDATTEISVSANYRVVSLHSRLYTRNVSLRRIASHRDTARAFAKTAARYPVPDIIFASYPIEELCREAIAYAIPKNVPVVVDVRDYWPDIFAEALPKPAAWIARLPLWALERQAARTLSAADALCSFTESGLEWSLRKSRRARQECDFWFPFSYKVEEHPAQEMDAARQYWRNHDAFDSKYNLQVCFFGALSHRYNLEAVVDAGRLLHKRNAPVSLVICGEGEAGASLRERAQDVPNIFFPGWVNAIQIRALMEKAKLGILPYNTPDYFMSLPNKFVEYLAGGLPVLSCTDGDVKRLLNSTNCGLWVSPSAASIAEGLIRLEEHPELIERMGRAAQQVFQSTFEEEIVFSHVFDHLRKIVERTRLNPVQGAEQQP